MFGNGTAAMNKAHREDMVWAKVGPHEYIRSDGTTIRQGTSNKFWYVFNADGSPRIDVVTRVQMRGHNLTWAKLGLEYDETHDRTQTI